MAAPLKKPALPATPARRLLNTGAAPQRTIRLKGSNGQTIVPKLHTAAVAKPEQPVPENPAPVQEPAPEESPAVMSVDPAQEETAHSAAEEEARLQAEEEARRQAEEEARRQAEEEARRQAEEEARRQAEEEARRQAEEEARRQAEEEARRQAEEEARAAEEEYRKQMEEYERQMREYKRQKAEVARYEAEEAQKNAEHAKVAAEEAHKRQHEAQIRAGIVPTASEKKTAAVKPAHAAKGPITSASGLTVAMPDFKKPSGAASSVHPTAAAASVPGAGAGKSALPSIPPLGARKPAGGGLPSMRDLHAPAPAKKSAQHERQGDEPDRTQQEKKTAKKTPKDYVNVSAEEQAELLHDVDAEYVEKLRSTATKKPIWKSVGFLGACAALVVFIGVCGALVLQHNAELDAKRAENAKIMKVLSRAQELNKQRIDTLADAKAKKVDVRCSKEEARFLMNVVVDPDMKDSDGKPLFGGHPEGVAQLACMLLSIAAEADADISKLVFDRLAKEAPKIKPTLYRWLVQRLAVADIKGVNNKLHHLAESVGKKSVKKFPKRDDILSYIWESMGLRVTEKDIPMITDLLRKPDISNGLARTLSHCLDNIVEQIDSMDKKKELGDKIFDLLPESQRQNLVLTLAKSCSPKALTYYKQRAVDPKNWRTDANYFSNYGDDDILDYLQKDLMAVAGADERKQKMVQSMINGVARQNRDRSLENAEKLVSMLYDKIGEDTSEWLDVMAKTNADAATFIGEDDPQYPALMEKRAALEKCRQQKLDCIKMLSAMYDWPWVVQYLERFSKEDDNVIASEAARALGQTHANRAENERVRAGYKKRTE